MYEAVKVKDFSDKMDAQLAGRMLESEGIPFLIRPEYLTPERDKIGMAIWVAPDIAERAREVLNGEDSEGPQHAAGEGEPVN